MVVILQTKSTYLLEIYTEIHMDDGIGLTFAGERKKWSAVQITNGHVFIYNCLSWLMGRRGTLYYFFLLMYMFENFHKITTTTPPPQKKVLTTVRTGRIVKPTPLSSFSLILHGQIKPQIHADVSKWECSLDFHPLKFHLSVLQHH